MSPPKVDSRLNAWPRVIVIGLVGIAVAGCADSARFQANSYASDRPSPPQSVSSLPAPATYARVEAQPLGPPATVAATNYGAQSPATHRSSSRYSDVTGSSVPPTSSHWTWNGGSAVTVSYGDTVESIARRHGVPASAILQTNGIRDASQIRAGAAPRYSAPHHQRDTNGGGSQVDERQCSHRQIWRHADECCAPQRSYSCSAGARQPFADIRAT